MKYPLLSLCYIGWKVIFPALLYQNESDLPGMFLQA